MKIASNRLQAKVAPYARRVGGLRINETPVFPVVGRVLCVLAGVLVSFFLLFGCPME
jgi:membrane protein YqaA with SNARE-associated domain